MKLFLTLMATAFLFVAPAYATKVSASWYDCSHKGQCSKSKRTASGEKFNPNAFTAAHRTYPFDTRLKVTYRGRSVIVKVNDRGPFVRKRSLDLSRGAARSIGCYGVCVVDVQVVGKGKKSKT